MKILIACEASGIVRDAFAAHGHDAWSCDIMPSDHVGNHIEGDVLDVLGDSWDMMIAFPPCTFLCVTANRVDEGERAAPRSRTFAGFAEAMASQWG